MRRGVVGCSTGSTPLIWRWAAATSVAVALCFWGATAARAVDAPAKALEVAAFIAGHPTQVICDADVNLSPAPPHVVDAWTIRGTGPIHLVPQLCADLSSRVGSTDFVRGIHALVHESAHARGVKNEACAELTSDLGVYEVLRRFYGVAFFTSESWRIGDQVLALTRALPADYQPEGCTTYG